MHLPLLDFHASAGLGLPVPEEVRLGAIAFDRQFLREKRASPAHCNIIRARGDSMSPTIPDGSLPPYWRCENDYGKTMFTRDDFALRADQLATLQGQFILSIYDVPEIPSIFAAFQIDSATTTSSIATGSNDQAELPISRL